MEWTTKIKRQKVVPFPIPERKKTAQVVLWVNWYRITQQGENKFSKEFQKQTANNLPKKTKYQDVWDHTTVKWHDQPEHKVPATLSKKNLESVNFFKKRSES